MISSIAEGFMAIRREECVIPAELIRISGISHISPFPSFLEDEVKAFFQIWGSEISAVWALIRDLSSLGVTLGFDDLKESWMRDIAWERVSVFRPMIWMEWVPVLENAWAMARPMPREPPVIRTRVGRCCVGVGVE
jgi:hypothetical protein